jgi:hypothetical protein
VGEGVEREFDGVKKAGFVGERGCIGVGVDKGSSVEILR